MARRPSVGDYIANIKAAAPKMVSGIKELAAAEIKPTVKHAGIGGGLLGGAAVFALTALSILVLAFAFGLSVFFFYVANRGLLVALTLGFLTAGVLLLLLAALLGLLGKTQVEKVKAPTMTIEETKKAINALGNSLTAGVADAKIGVVDRHRAGRPWDEVYSGGATEARYVADPLEIADRI